MTEGDAMRLCPHPHVEAYAVAEGLLVRCVSCGMVGEPE